MIRLMSAKRAYNWFISLVAASCMVLYGYDASVFNSVQGSDNWKAWFNEPGPNLVGSINTAYTVGAIFGGFFVGGPTADFVGRKAGMGIGCVFVIVATFMQTFSPYHNIACFIAGRVLIGIGQGIALTAGPIYIGELAPPEIRGIIMTFWQMFYSVGSFICFWINYACTNNVSKLGEWDWKMVVIFQLLVPVLILIALPTIPGSPRWFIQRGNNVDKAREALQRVRDTEEEVEDELLRIREAIEYEKEAISGNYSALWKDKSLRKRMGLALVLNAGQQLTGQGSLNSYSTKIYEKVFTSKSQIALINALNATFGILFTLNAVWFVDRFGRKVLLIGGAIGMAICMVIVAAVETETPELADGAKSESVGIAIVFLLFLFILFYKPSWGATVWIWTSEIFSMNVRAQAVGMASQTQNVANTIFQQFFPIFLDNDGFYAFYLFAGINILLGLFVFFLIPETKKVPLEEIDTLFGGANHVVQGEEVLAKQKEQRVYGSETAAEVRVENVRPGKILTGRLKGLTQAVVDDPNVGQFLSLTSYYGPKIPKASARYLAAKVPIVQWAPRYKWQWLWSDLVAGITIGVLLVPQSLAYAKVANIPGRYGLISSWLPTLFYTVMGTSKDVTAGPTAIMGLLTGEIVKDLVSEGYPAEAVASAAAFWVGIYSLILGLSRLGFLLDFIPLPILSGYVSGAAITIILQQLKALFGEPKKGSTTAEVIRLFFQELPQTNWRAFVIGISGIVLLLSLQLVGRKWGKKYRSLWYLSIARNALVLVIFTLISWGVNKSRPENPLFGLSKVTGAGIVPPRKPDSALLVKVAGRSVAVFLAAALEHLAIGMAFSRRYGYVLEKDQELTYIGLVNLFGSFFSCMPITGGFSRTAVNAESGVKSPLAGLATTACVLVSIYKLTDAFYWIPGTTLSAIIILAVWQIVIPPRVFWHYWKTSFADFVGSMVAFWVTLFVSVEIGIAAAVGYSLVYILLQLAFSRVTMVTSGNVSQLYPSSSSSTVPLDLPEDTMVFVVKDSILYPNAARIARQVTDYVYAYSSGGHEDPATQDTANSEAIDMLWNDTKTRHVAMLRKAAGTHHMTESSLPYVKKVVIDLTRTTHVDTTGMQAISDIRTTFREWAGPDSSVSFVGLNERVRTRFERTESCFRSAKQDESPKDEGYIVFDVLQTALYGCHFEKQDPSLPKGSVAEEASP